MRAVRFSGDGVELEKLPDPRPVQRGATQVRVISAGICGSDLGFIAQGGIPVTPGHEVAGVTADGRTVAVQPNAVCRDCEFCVTGRSNLCAEAMTRFAGMAGVDGGFADQMLAYEAQLHELPAGLSPEFGALAEPAAVAMHAVRQLNAPSDKKVLVIGAGTIGLIAAAMLGHSAHVVTKYPHQTRAASAMGLRDVEPNDAGSSDAVIDAAGTQASLDLAVESIRPGGSIVTLGGAGWQPRLNDRALFKEVGVRVSLIYTAEDFRDALAFVASRDDLPPALVTHRFALNDAGKAFTSAGARESSQAIKVLIHP